MRALILAFGLLVVGCNEPWDPVGTYEMAQIWGAGDCNLSTPRLILLTVTTRPDGSFLVETDLDGDVEGRVLRINDEECRLEFQVEEPPGLGLSFTGRTVLLYNIIEDGRDVEGDGLLTVGSPDNCTQVFSVEGDRR